MANTKLATRGSTDRLNDRQRAFVAEYVKDYNSTRAASVVGYKRPGDMGQRLINGKTYPKVANAIGKIQRLNLEQCILTKNDILAELSLLAMRDIIELCDKNGQFFCNDLRDLPPNIRRCIDAIEVFQDFDDEGKLVGQRFKLKLVAKLGAIEMLAKHFGMFASTQEHEHKVKFDWDSMYSDNGQPDELDIIEGKIAKAEE